MDTHLLFAYNSTVVVCICIEKNGIENSYITVRTCIMCMYAYAYAAFNNKRLLRNLLGKSRHRCKNIILLLTPGGDLAHTNSLVDVAVKLLGLG